MAEKTLYQIKKEEAKAKLPQVPLGTDLSGTTITTQTGQPYTLKNASSGITPTVPKVPTVTPVTPVQNTPTLPKVPTISPQAVSAEALKYNDNLTRDAKGNIVGSSDITGSGVTGGGKFLNDNLNPNYKPTSQDDIDSTLGLTAEMRNKWYANLYGGFSDKIPSTIEGENELFLNNQKDTKDELDRIVDSQVAQYERNAAANSSAIDSQFAQNREGVVSEGNKLTGEAAKVELLASTDQAINQLRSQQSQLARLQLQQQQQYLASREDQIDATRRAIAESQAEIAKAQQQDFQNTISLVNSFKDNPGLAYLSADQRAAIQTNFPQFPGLVDSLAKGANATITDKNLQTKFDNQTKAISAMKDLVAMGIQITPAMAQDYAAQTGLPIEAIINFNDKAQAVMGDNKLDQAQKIANLGKSEFELDQLHAGVTNETLENMQYLTNLYKQGRFEEAKLAKKLLKISDEDDPMYLAQLAKTAYEGQALAIGLKYLDQEKQADLLGKITDTSTKQTLLQYLPAEKQLGIALQNADLDYKTILNQYLPNEKEATINQILQNIEKGDIELAWLPKEKQAAVGKAVLEMADMALRSQYADEKYQNESKLQQLDIASKTKGLTMTDYDLIIKQAQANGASEKELADLTKLKAEAKKAQIETAELTGEDVLPDNYELGSVASKYESGGDYGRISSGVGDPGGKSYGKYQFASNMGSLKNFINESGFAKDFEGLSPKSASFDSKWTELAQNPAFQKAQDNYIKNHYYIPFKDKVVTANPGLANRGAAINEMLWSTSVQYGPNSSVVNQALAGKDVASMTDAQIIEAVQNQKMANSGALAPGVRQGVKNRIVNEKQDLLDLDKKIIKNGETKKAADEQQVQNIRKEFLAQPTVEDYRLLKSDYENFQKTVSDYKEGKIDKPTRDLVVSRLFQQMITQRTIMRENDFTRIGNNQGYVDTLLNYAERAQSGGDLDDKQVNALISTASNLFNSAQNEFRRSADFYASEADRLKVDRERILGAYKPLFDSPISTETKASNSLIDNLVNFAKAHASESPQSLTQDFLTIPEDMGLNSGEESFYAGDYTGNIFESILNK